MFTFLNVVLGNLKLHMWLALCISWITLAGDQVGGS